ncbi:MAG TPA: ABC transporter ATP-binding protein [Candidatus Xenobia bacterium]|nr:ABC transporter ATP-binding protein [Candidatus Xenobia bacterium]
MSDAHHEEEALGQVTDWRPALRLFRYLRPYAGRVALAVVLLLVASGFEIIQPIFYKVAIDHYLSPSAAGQEHGWLAAWLPADPLAGLNLLALTFAGLLVLSFVMGYVQAMLTMMTGQYVMYDLRREIFGHLQKLHIGFYDRNPVGRLVTRVTNDVETLNELFTAGVNALFGDIIVLVGIVAVLFYYDWQLALLTLAVLPLIGAVTIAFRNYARDAFRRTRTAIARINAFLNEHLSGMSVVQLFNRESRAARDFDAVNEENRRAWRDAILAHALFYPAVEFLSVLAIAAIVVYGGWQVQLGEAGLGTVVAFLMYARRFFYPIQDLSEKYGILQQALASSERVFKLLDTQPAITAPAQPRRLPSTDGRGAGKVEFRNVWFAYKDEDWVLQDVSFTIEPGEMTAIVGHTGAGKTTLISLLLRFYDVQKGQILLDGVDIRELDLDELRRPFGIVLQDPFIFSGTIASNVRLGSEHISDQDVERALENVNLGGFVRVLPEGLAHETRERGATLSVGQKQLLSFARALAHDPRILILDEATSSVDTATEFQIRAALERLISGRTSIVIAHRLSTVQRADRILVLHKGRLREQGTHQELLAQRGLYFKLYQLQYRDQEVGAVADD